MVREYGQDLARERELLSLGKRIQRWRQGKSKPNSKMPEELWRAAISLAKTHGRGSIVKAFGLDHSTLKRRLEQEKQASRSTTAAPEFLELFPRPPGPDCCIEVFAAQGARLKISMPANQNVDWSGIVGRFLSHRR